MRFQRVNSDVIMSPHSMCIRVADGGITAHRGLYGGGLTVHKDKQTHTVQEEREEGQA